MADFFVSYNSADKAWAEWIAWTLEEAGYSVIIQAWDFRPGDDFVQKMQEAAKAASKTIAVLSENYLKAKFTQPEWSAAFAKDPTGEKRSLIVVRVSECQPEGMLATRVYVDLVGLSQDDARASLLGAMSARAKPEKAPAYPGQPVQLESVVHRAAAEKKEFPGRASQPVAVPSIAAIQEATAQATSRPFSSKEVIELHHDLERLRPQYFNLVVFALDPPPGRIQAMPAAQAVRTKELLNWAKKDQRLDEVRSAIDAVRESVGDAAFEEQVNRTGAVATINGAPRGQEGPLSTWQLILLLVILLGSSAYFLPVDRWVGAVFVSLAAALVLFGVLSSVAEVENRLGKFGGPAALFIVMLLIIPKHEDDHYVPCAEVAAGAAMSGYDLQNQIVDEVESSPGENRRLLRLDDAVKLLYAEGAKLERGVEHQVYAYRTRPFAKDAAQFSVSSETFRNANVKVRLQGYLLSNHVPDFIDDEEPSQNNVLVLQTPKNGAFKGDQLILLILAWGPKNSLPAVGSLRFQCK